MSNVRDSATRSIELTILLPAYNEEQSIGTTIREIRQLYPDYEILVVDDGSTDNTRDEAVRAGANVMRHPHNIGNGAAIKTGLRYASGEWVLMMDADGQHKTADIARLLQQKDAYDMVVGARSKGSRTSWHRDLANFIYNWLASYITKFKVEDLTSGFRLVKNDRVAKYIYLLPNTFSYPSTITLAYLRSGLSIKYVPIQTLKDRHQRIASNRSDRLRIRTGDLIIVSWHTPTHPSLPTRSGALTKKEIPLSLDVNLNPSTLCNAASKSPS